MNSNSLQAYYSEIGSLNRNEISVYKYIKHNPDASVEMIMSDFGTENPNSVAPRCTDLKNKNLIKVVSKIKNKKGHLVDVFKIVESNEFKPRINPNLKTLYTKLAKCDRVELELLEMYIKKLKDKLL